MTEQIAYQTYDDVLSAADLQRVSKLINGAQLPWYYFSTSSQYGGVPTDNQVLVHTLMERPEVRPDDRVVSEHFELFQNLFTGFCQRNSIAFEQIFRAALNLTFYNPSPYGFVHNDHRFQHKNFVLYLNEFSGGPTYIMKDQNTILTELEAKKNRAAIFNGCLHAQGFCGPGEKRIVLALTFA